MTESPFDKFKKPAPFFRGDLTVLMDSGPRNAYK